MKNKFFIALLAFLLVVPGVLAGNFETNNFFIKGTSTPVTGVAMQVFTCTDNNEQCVTVAQPAAITANSGGSNTITVQYPGTANPTDYAEYFYALGYLPMEFVVPNDWGTGLSFTYSTYFEKGVGCHSPVESFSMVNSVYADEPLVINIRTALDATTYSAFHDPGTPPFFVPDALKAEYYSALTNVILNIYDPSGALIYTETQQYNIYMDSKQDVQFQWTPTVSGNNYRAEIVTNVVDSQCSSSNMHSTSKIFEVLPARAQDECYTLLNDLAINNVLPVVGNAVTANYTKISNYIDSSFAKTAIPTDATYSVFRGKLTNLSTLVFSSAQILPATAVSTPTQFLFSFTPANTGWHTVQVTGSGNSPLCSGKNNPMQTINEEILVLSPPMVNVIFTVRDLLTTNPISGATASIAGSSAATNSAGVATVTGVSPGVYTFTVSHPNYQTVSGTVTIGTVDAYIDVQLFQQNIGPIIVLDSIDPFNMVLNTPVTIDFGPYVSDQDNTDAQLILTAAGNSNIGVSISGMMATFTPSAGFTGSNTMTFTIRDPSGATDSDTLRVNVNAANSAPAISGLPDITLNENQNLFDAFNLNNFASDLEDMDSALTYSLTPNACGATADALDNVDIQPPLNFNGACSVVATVTDTGGLTGTDTFIVTVTGVNNAPFITSFPPPTTAYVNQPYVYDADAFDADGDPITFSLATLPSGMTINPVTGLVQWTPTNAQLGLNPVTVQVSDGSATGIQSYTITVSINQSAAEENDNGHSNDLLLASIIFNDGGNLKRGEDLIARVKLENIGKVDLEDVRVTISIPELAVWARDGPFDIDDGKEVISRTLIPLNDAMPGEYYVRIGIGSHQFTRSKYRPIVIEG